MALITYDDKVALNENPSVPDINKVKNTDMNEIKSVVNTNDSNFSTLQTNYTNSTKYSTTKTIVGYLDNNTPVYRQVFEGTLPNSGTGLVNSTLRSSVDKIVAFGGYINQTDGTRFGLPSTNPSGNADSNVVQRQFSRIITTSSGDLRLDGSNTFKGQTYWVWVDYTEASE